MWSNKNRIRIVIAGTGTEFVTKGGIAMKQHDHLKNMAYVILVLVTLVVMVYAFFHRENGGLVYIIFNSYALLAVIISMISIQRRAHASRRKREAAKKRLLYLTKNLSAPAMLWNDNFTEVVLNDTLMQLAEMKMREDFNAKLVVPMFFGKKEMQDADIREVVLTRNLEYAFTAPSGAKHDLIWNTASVETDADGVTWLISIGTDLADLRMMRSELEQASRRLNASEGKHNLMMEMMDVGLLLIEQGNPRLFPSEKLRKMLGLTGDFVTVSELQKKVYPLDRVVFDNHVAKMRNHMRDYVGKPDVVELRLCAADGQYRWFSYRFKATQHAGNGRLIVGGSVIDITKEKEKDAMIEKIAYEDAVTGISNRNKLMLMGQELFQSTQELNLSYWVIVMDLDRFHLINDSCGYTVGNDLLRSFAGVMIAQLSLGGFGARISGDNFALILRDTGDDTLPETVVARIQRMLGTKAVGPLSNLSLTCSAGYAKLPADGSSFEEVLEHAEFALSSASETLGSVRRYTPAMHDTIIQESNLETQLSDAIMRGELVLYYQPKVALDTGEMIGVEALVRWKQPSGNLLSPSVFIPIAEKSQLITQITRFVLYEACRQLSLWRMMALPEVRMSLNFSSTDFYQENICDQILDALYKNGLDPSVLEIELTESLAMKDIDLAIDRMQALRKAGIGIAMDDFGTGYSSLSYMQRLPFTMVKLDRSFVMHMKDDPVVQEIVHSVARIAKSKQIHTIAEGVETAEQAEQLRAAGCDYAQGYLYGHPMTAKELEQYIRTHRMQQKTLLEKE